MSILTTLAKLKTHLGIAVSDTTEDVLLNQILAEIDQVCFRFMKRPQASFVSAAATEYYDGSGRDTLILKRRPVTAVASVWVDNKGFYGQAPDAFPTSSLLTVGVDYVSPSLAESEENAGLLLCVSDCWPTGRGNIKVTYTAGYSTIPDDLTLAANLLAAAVRKSAASGQAGPLASETLGEYSYTVLTGTAAESSGLNLATNARKILAHYREVCI